MDKKQQLLVLFGEMERANLPLREKSPLIPGEGNPDAKVLFIGEAGGYHEARLKRPFVGQAGRLLDQLLSENNMPRETVWITNVVKARPPQNRDPLPEEIEAYRPYLERELAIIQPEIIATLGRFAMNWFLGDEKISRVHGVARRISSGVIIFPLYHPAAALRSSQVLDDLKHDFSKLSALVHGTAPTSISAGAQEVIDELNNQVEDQVSPPQGVQQSLF